MFTFRKDDVEYENCQFLQEGSGAHVRYTVFSNGSEKDGEMGFPGPVMKLNLPGYTAGLGKEYQKDSIIVVRDYSENEGTLDFLDNVGVIKTTIGYLNVEGSHVDFPVVELDLGKLKELNDCKFIDFSTGLAVDKEGNLKGTPSVSITTFDKTVEALDKQDGYTIADEKPLFSFKVRNVVRTEVQVRPVKGGENVYHVTELSPLFGGVVQDFYARIKTDELFAAMGVSGLKDMLKGVPDKEGPRVKGSLKPKRPSKGNVADKERDIT